MGLATIYAAMSVSDHPLNIERCNIVGLQKTFSSDEYITDSAAAGTALATSNKTNNGVIGMDTLGIRVTSILEIAEEHGLSTGLVSTSSITHMTKRLIHFPFQVILFWGDLMLILFKAIYLDF